MSELLEIVAGFLGATILGGISVAAVSMHRLSRRNRVDPSAPSPAPRRWLISPSRPAALHRRLRNASLLVLAATSSESDGAAPRGRSRRRRTTAGSLEGAGREVVARAATLDARLVAASRSGPEWRRRRMAELRREIDQLEATAARVADLSIDLRRHLDRVTNIGEPLGADLDGFEAALDELGVRHRPG